MWAWIWVSGSYSGSLKKFVLASSRPPAYMLHRRSSCAMMLKEPMCDDGDEVLWALVQEQANFWGCEEILPGCSQTCPKILQNSAPPKKCSSCQFGRHYFQIKACWAPFVFRRFRNLEDFPGFYGILPGFSQYQNFWGCSCSPCTPTSYTSACEPVASRPMDRLHDLSRPTPKYSENNGGEKN